jgi:RNA polymerase sigma-54 factor
MKQSFQLCLGQQITMTPQLQKAIRLLTLSNASLQTEIQQMLDSNIMLELLEDEYETEDEEELDFSELEDASNDSTSDSQDSEEEQSDETVLDNIADDIPQELPADSDWDDIYNDSNIKQNSNGEVNNKNLVQENRTEETLQSNLLWQLSLTPFSNSDRVIAMAIIDAINSDGYLCASLEEIAESLRKKNNIDIREIKAVLHRIQHFEPLGVGARTLSECLFLQLSEYKSDTPWLKEAKRLVRKYLALLSTHDYTKLTKRMRLTHDELQKVLNLVHSLNPCPWTKMEDSQANFVTPDVFVKKVKNQWKAELNSDFLPKLRVNKGYTNLISTLKKGTDNETLKTHLQEARWFIKSLRSRQETLLKVAQCIVSWQTGFFDYGEEAMKPLVLHDIAETLEMHESTISRVTTQKYLHTPQGVFELKYFFSGHINTQNGRECSSIAIRAMIKKMVTTEDSTKPLSDKRITELLSERGINVARRTVAKYREAMVIPPSNERKRLN